MKINIGPYPGIKSKKERRVDIRIDKYDTWNMDATLALIIVPMLKQLKKDKHGAGNVDDEDVPENIRSTAAPKKENEWDIDKFWFKRWNWVVSEMIWAFEQCNKDWETKYYKGKIDTIRVPINKKGEVVDEKDAEFFRMDEGPKHTFKIDKEGLDNHWKRMQNGFRLFGKYYTSLWD